MVANKVNTRLLIRTIVRDFLLSAKSSFIMCQAKEGARWKYGYSRSVRMNIGVEGRQKAGRRWAKDSPSIGRGNLCIKHLQQLLLIVGRAYAYKCYHYPMACRLRQQYRVWQVCSIIKAQTRLRQRVLIAFACEARTLWRVQTRLVSKVPWGVNPGNALTSTVWKFLKFGRKRSIS